MTRTKKQLQADARCVTRSLRVYVCPTCKRRAKAVRKPKRCCGVPLVYVGSVTEVIHKQKGEKECKR
jgi:hypothetical protein